MPKSGALRAQDARAIFELANVCRELGDDNPSWRLHYLEALARIVGADVSLGGELCGVATGEPRALSGVASDWGFENGLNRKGMLQGLELFDIDPTYSSLIRGYFGSDALNHGAALRGSDLVRGRDWERCLEYDVVYRAIGVNHSICGFHVIPGHPDEALGGFLLRAEGRRDFSLREAAVVCEANRVLAPMVGGPLARFVEPSPRDLPPRVRDVLRCVLEGDSDKQIALRLRISKHTVNQYVKTAFRHLGVQSRPELLARWIRRGWGTRFAWATVDESEGP